MNDTNTYTPAAVYARVSSDRQAVAGEGCSLTHLGEHHYAVEDYDVVLSFEPRPRGHARQPGSVPRRAERLPGAIEDFHAAIGLDGGQCRPALQQGGCAYAALGDPGRAVGDYGRVIAIDPRMAIAYHNWGIAYRDMGDLSGP